MPKLIEFQPVGIKCDMPGCDWRDGTVVFDTRTLAREWLNKPCPQCNGNLYTERDYKMVRRIARSCRVINALFGWMLWLVPKEKRGEAQRSSLYSDGRGFITEAEVEPGSVMEQALKRAAMRNAMKERASLSIEYELTPGKKLRFMWTVLCMDACPIRTRLELCWSAIRSNDGKAKGEWRGPKPVIEYMMKRFKEVAGG